MPSTSKKQHNFMAAVANSPAFAKKVGVSQAVGQDFSNADKGKTFKRGGDMATKMNPGFMAMMKKKGTKKMAAGGMPMKDGKPAFIGDGEGAMKSGGSVKKMMGGGMSYAAGGMPAALAKHAAKPASKAHAGLKAGGMAKLAGGGYTVPPNGIMDSGGGAARYAKGGSTGSFRASANGIATQGKTKAKQIKMNKGGMAC